jgi:hypothetical protein
VAEFVEGYNQHLMRQVRSYLKSVGV